MTVCQCTEQHVQKRHVLLSLWKKCAVFFLDLRSAETKGSTDAVTSVFLKQMSIKAEKYHDRTSLSTAAVSSAIG